MLKLAFLDIDDVLLPWDFRTISDIVTHSGFSDWKKPGHPYMKYVSFDLLNHVWGSIGDKTYWLTTWELHNEGANALFAKRLGLEPLKEIPFIGDYFHSLGLYTGTTWWKSTILNRFVSELKEEYRVVWIDNEINDQIRNGNVHQELIDDPNILRISCYPCLTKEQIDEAAAWLA